MTEIKTLASVAIGEICEIKDLGGKWRVISDDVTRAKVQNTKSNQEMILPKTKQLK